MRANKTMLEQASSIILLIDDNPTNIGVVADALEQRDHRVLVAQDGTEGLARAELVHPDLILLDIMMPDMDGFAVCRRLKETPSTRDIPVIFMTALTAMDDKLAAFEAGAVDYVTKPLQIEEVVARAETQLKLGSMRKRLEAHRSELEQRVAERTAELDQSNRQLREEVAQRRKIQEELATREREFRTLAEHLPDNLARYDRHGCIVYFNPALETTLGLTTAEVQGKIPIETLPGPGRHEFQRYLMQTLTTGLPSEFELQIPDADIGMRLHHILFAAEHEADGTVSGALAIGRDITARKHAEREVKMLNLALDQAFDAVYLLDVDHNIRYVNKAAMQALGYTYNELLSLKLFDIDPDITREEADELAKRVIQHGRLPTTVESRHRRKNGETFPVEIGGATFRHEGESLFLATVRDISERKEAERLLHEQQEALRAALDNAPDAIVRYDRTLQRTYLNTTMQRALSFEPYQLLGSSPVDFSPVLEQEKYVALLRHVLETGAEQQEEFSFSAKGETRWADLRLAPEFDANGRVASVLLFGRDVTSRHRMERENALLRAMADNAVDPLIFAHSLEADAGLPMYYTNPSFAQHLGYEAEEMQGLRVSDVTGVNNEELAARMEELRRRKSLRFETEHRRKNGEWVPVEVTLSYLTHNDEELAAGYCMNISQRKEAEQRLQESHAQLQAFSSRLDAAREQERKHIARELHDDLGQCLTALRLQISAMGIELNRKDSALAQKVKGMLSLLDSTMQAVRNMSQKLRPAVLDMGVGAALDWLSRNFEKNTGIPCELVMDGHEATMPDECATVTFRVVQESLTNIARHAQARSAAIFLKRWDENHTFVLEISDNGKGFIPTVNHRDSFGLVGMRERLLAVGGTLEIISAPQKGTRVIARIPLNKERVGE